MPLGANLKTLLVRLIVQGEEYLLQNMRHICCEQLVEGTDTQTITCFHDGLIVALVMQRRKRICVLLAEAV